MDFQNSKAWPYEEARSLIKRGISGDIAVFETGFGSSGRPHLGTFAEVVRTNMVRKAYTDLTGQHSRLIVFADDLDALRKVPENIPNREQMETYLGYAVSSIPDPYGEHESFAHGNNALLRRFLENFGYRTVLFGESRSLNEYEFISSTEIYESGRFNDALMRMSDRYEKVLGIIRPTVGEDRRATYSPFMPRMPDGRIIDTGVTHSKFRGVVYFDDGGKLAYDVRDGNVKCQWKADWALRWYALGVDYEMAGKDLIDSVQLSSKIVRALGGKPPVNMIYEMFLDEDGRKISKSLGNGLTIDQWLNYGTADSLSYYLYQHPKKAAKLYPAMVGKTVDEYYEALKRYPTQTPEQQLGNAVYHVHHGVVDASRVPPFSYQLLLNIASTAAVEEPRMLWSFVQNYFPDASGDSMLIMYRVFSYYRAHLAGKLKRRVPTVMERTAILRLAEAIETITPLSGPQPTDEDIQFHVYEVGKEFYGKDNLRAWFMALYQIILGQDSGPRFGAFAVLYGVRGTINLLRKLATEQVVEHS